MNYLLVMPKKLSTGATTTSIIFPMGIAYVSAALKQAGYCVFTARPRFYRTRHLFHFAGIDVGQPHRCRVHRRPQP